MPQRHRDGQGGWKRVELRQLRYFAAVAREGHFGQAARALRIAQPAVSRQIQQLEAELGVRLFDRRPRGAVLTAEGLALLDRAERLLGEAEAMRREARGQADRPRGAVTIGLSPGVSEIIGAAFATAAARRFPEIRLRLAIGFMHDLEKQLEDGAIDAAVLNGPGASARLAAEPLLAEPLCLICTAGDRRFEAPAVPLRALAGVPLVLAGRPESWVRRALRDALGQEALDIEVAAEADTVALAKRLVLAGLGPMVDVASMVRAEILEGRLRAVPLGALGITRLLVMPRGRDPSPAAAAAAGLLRDCAREMLANGLWLGARTPAASAAP